ncbi:non-homologous end-joining DNA ligase [Agilicoccus flavus]|uniref:non-homologous end-joining DNA ligase n=1 Tax=Agilicoccus flavus TaxID=2775968 RepID=UPI001CF686CE|nr:non-homologous end-joining DNA ligase [Agilicoccus flavus]
MPDPSGATRVSVGDRTLSVSNLDKVLYPETGTTKAEVVHYLTQVAPVLLPQLRDRVVTRVRWPHGTGGPSFFEKNVPAGAPAWVRRVTLPAPGSGRGSATTITYPFVDDVAGLVWLANLAALELHTHQWRVLDGAPVAPDRLVVDLDPGSPAGLAECARVALLVRDTLADVAPGPCVPVTSGSKGMQLYARSPDPADPDATRTFAEALAQALASGHPDLVVARMTKNLRGGKVFLDWSQNTRAKTTICPYSLRGKHEAPYVAAPRTWDEVEAAAAGRTPLRQLSPAEVVDRLVDGDPMAALDDPDA